MGSSDGAMRNPVVLVLDFFDQAALQQSRLYRKSLELTMETKVLATPGMIQALIRYHFSIQSDYSTKPRL